MIAYEQELAQNIIQTLGKNLSRPELLNYYQYIQIVEINAQEIFWRSAEAMAGIYILLEGTVEVLEPKGNCFTLVRKNESFGESTLFPDENYQPYYLKARENLKLAYLNNQCLQPLINKYPEIRTHLYRRAIELDLLILNYQVSASNSYSLENLKQTLTQLKQHYLFVGKLPPAVWKKQRIWLLRRGEILHSTGKRLTPGNLYTLSQLPKSGIWQITKPTELYSLDDSNNLDNSSSKLVRRKRRAKISRAYFPSPTVKLTQWWQGKTRRYPFLKQQSASDCGVACLVMVTRYWGKNLSVSQLRNLANTDRTGTSLRGLIAAAENIGLSSRPVQVDLRGLAQQNLPAIAHWKGNHYVVVYKITRDQVIVADPAMGMRTLTHQEFPAGWAGYTILLQPTALFKEVEKADHNLWQFFELVKPHWLLLLQVILASVLLQIFGLLIPLFTQLLLDRVVVQRSIPTFTALGIGLIVFSLFQVVIASLRRYLLFHTANRIDLALIVGFISHTFRLPLNYFETRYVGDITSRIQENRKIRTFLASDALTTILDLMTVFFYIAMMFWYSWQMAAIGLIIVPLYIFVAFVATPFLQKISREIFQAYKTESSYLIEALTGIGTVKALGIEKIVRWSWEGLFNQSVRLNLSGQIIQERIKLTTATVETLIVRIILLVGVWQVIHNRLTIGQIIAFNMLLANVVSPFERLISLWNSFQEVLIAVERTNDVIEAQPEEDQQAIARSSLPPLRGHIRFEQVSFRYNPESKTNTLDNLSFEIKPGQTVAIVGRSGSGKTTIAKLLLGFYLPTEGKILIDGYDLTTISLSSLRSQIGVVDQNTFLFGGTIRENLSLAQPKATMTELEAAASLAGADRFIDELPMKYETQIGEGGRLLSGGQRQRLAIARALLRHPRLLIFDEATSNLDAESERIIQTNLNTILKQQTTIVIAHRLSTVRNADLILVLDRGVVVESGTHQELMTNKGQYFYLNQQQLT